MVLVVWHLWQGTQNPGRDSIAAVLNPEDTKDLYFVADGTGGHVFAATVDEQNKNVAKWRKIYDR